jgi:hypothetical protein
LDPEELAYKFPAGSSRMEDLIGETTLNQEHTLNRDTFIAEWDGDSDSSRVDMRDSAANDVYVPIETDATKYKLSWASTISVGENAVAVYNPPADILPSDLLHQPTAASLNHIFTQMVQDGLSRHSSGYSNVIDDEDSASVGTEEFDNWIHGSKVSTQATDSDSFKGSFLIISSLPEAFMYILRLPLLNSGSASAFEQNHINVMNTPTKRVSQLSTSSHITSAAAVVAVNQASTRRDSLTLHSQTHTGKLQSRQHEQSKSLNKASFELPDKLLLEYKDSTVFVVESSIEEHSNDMELASTSILLHIQPSVSPIGLQHAAATKIQALWRGYTERKLNPPTSARALLLITTLNMRFQQRCNGSVDRKLRGLKHRLLQEARFRVRSERQLQKLGEINRKERDELCRLLDNENATLESQERFMRESTEKAEVTYYQLQTERHERENLERVVQLATKEISAQAEREMQRSKEMDLIQRRVEKLASELRVLKLDQTSSHSRPRRSVSPTHSIKSLTQNGNVRDAPSPDSRASYRHRMRPSAVPRVESASSSNANAALYQKIPAGKDILKFTSANPKTNAMLLKGKSLIPTNNATTVTHERRR